MPHFYRSARIKYMCFCELQKNDLFNFGDSTYRLNAVVLCLKLALNNTKMKSKVYANNLNFILIRIALNKKKKKR